ncbi:thiosulfate sulfurtransferase GlpE [Halomonas sp. DP5Y7-2]|uniref:thiosulfate sulfurtransferase GlpE n=1 Tax=Halomonas sp. DP5Y7-2 TaxID=2859076 RepID=UPI001C9955FB|nr:thiosulfate sulfurtransferase GlpE [Halomonas sp. DP5Y7-2]MBY5984076.1 thiosulfate sulfurtransferase GlpE [Halomonas sp. DP5Y7-2]
MTPATFEHLDIERLQQWLDQGSELCLVDIRDPGSFAQGHIPGSRHLDNDSVGPLVAKTAKDTPLVVVCYHGHSSQQAASWLAAQGFTQVYSLDGGFTQWQHVLPERVSKG